MDKYLISVTEKYRINTQSKVDSVLEEAKNATEYELNKYNCSYKEVKQKGEVVDSYYVLTLVKNFTNEKEPERNVEISYGAGGQEVAF